MIRRALETAVDMPRKMALLPAGIEICIACGELDAADGLCGDMAAIAELFGTEILARVADQSLGTLALARGEFAEAINLLSRARRYWSAFGEPYLVARLRVDIARGLVALGDVESAEMELDEAEKVFQDLGAAPDLAGIAAIRGRSEPATCILTVREREVLSLIAARCSDREIAGKLGLSLKTVNRHAERSARSAGAKSRA